MQLATDIFLNRPIAKLNSQSFLEYTGIPPRNVLFCTKRSGGESSGNQKVRLTPLNPKDKKRGPRVAMGNEGKGAIARTLQLTHLIDDRADCLLSFALEGHFLDKGGDGALIHFGSHATVPGIKHIEKFIESKCNSIPPKKRKSLAEACRRVWIPANNQWPDVLEAFGLDTTQQSQPQRILNKGPRDST